MRSAFILLVFPNSMFTPILVRKGYVLSGEIALINNHYYYYMTSVGKGGPEKVSHQYEASISSNEAKMLTMMWHCGEMSFI